MKMVKVIWEDAGDIDTGPWVERAGLTPSKAIIIHQIGYVVEDTEEALVLTSAVEEDFLGIRSRIPRGMIKNVVELTTKRKRA